MLNIRAIAPHSLVCAVLAASLAACSPPVEANAPAAQPESPAVEESKPAKSAYVDRSTAGITEHHFKTLVEGDLEGLLAAYADDAFILTPQGAVKGKEAIRERYAALVKEFGQEGTTFNRGDVRVNREAAYVTWTAETASNTYAIGTDTFVVQEGQIVAQTFAAHILPKTTDEEAPAADQPAALPETPTSTLARHRATALEKGQLDELMSDYTTLDSIILTQTGKKSDIQTIEIFSQKVIDRFQNPKTKFEVKTMLVEGEIGFIFWAAETPDDGYRFVADTVVVRDEKIAYQTVTFSEKK